MHISGRPRVVDDSRALEILRISAGIFQDGVGELWGMDDAGAFVDGRLKAVVAFEFVPERVQGKFKLSQNRSAEDRGRVIERLAARDDAESRSTAALMRQRGQSS